MPRFAAVSTERHGRKKWRHFKGFDFAAADALAPIVGIELSRAVTVSMPCAFLEHSGRYTLVAVLSLVPGRNMFVGPGGHWLGSYVPAWFRLHPFRILPRQGTADSVLCVDEGSGLVVEHGAAGEDFFDAEGKLAPALKPVFETLMQVERNRAATDLAVAALAQAGVIRPWQFKVKTDQGAKTISGLHSIDDAALHSLPNDVFLQLRTASALPLAYAQMLSARRIDVFEQLARLHNLPAPPPVAALPESLDDFFDNLKDDKIRFN